MRPKYELIYTYLIRSHLLNVRRLQNLRMSRVVQLHHLLIYA